MEKISKHIFFSNLLVAIFFIGFPFLNLQHTIIKGNTEACILVLFSITLFILLEQKLSILKITIIDILVFAIGIWCGIRSLFMALPPDRLYWILFGGSFLFYFVIRQIKIEKMVWYGIFISGIVQALAGNICFANNGPYGAFLAIALVAGIGLLLNSRKWIGYFISLAGVIIIGPALYLSDSRSAWLAAIGGCFCLLYVFRPMYFKKFQKRIQNRKWVYGLAIAFVATLLIGLYYYKPTSANGRLLIWKIGCQMYGEAPVIGHGAKTFEREYMYQQAAFFRDHPQHEGVMLADNNWYAFNEILHFFCNWGTIGGAMLLLLIFLLCTKIFRIPNIASGIIITLSIFACFSYPASIPSLSVIYFFTIACLINGIPYQPIFCLPFGRLLKLITTTGLVIVAGYSINVYCLYTQAEQALKNGIKDEVHSAVAKEYYSSVNTCPDFTLYLGKLYYQKQDYDEAILVLSHATRLRPTVEMLCDLGECFQCRQEISKAEECFLLARRMIPSRILPYHYLFKLYCETGQEEKASKIAREIATLKIKVTNSLTLDVKREAKDFLLKTH